MKYLVFRRFEFNIKKEMQYSLDIVNIASNRKLKFNAFIESLIDESNNNKSYINVYVVRNYCLEKVCFIKEGQLFTL